MNTVLRTLILASVLIVNFTPAQAQVTTEKTKVKETPFGTAVKRTEKTRLGATTIRRTERGMVPAEGVTVRHSNVRIRRGFGEREIIRRDVRRSF